MTRRTAIGWWSLALLVVSLGIVAGNGGKKDGVMVLAAIGLIGVLWAIRILTPEFWVKDMPEEMSEWDERDRNGCHIPDCPSCFVDHSWDTEDDEEKAA